MPKMNDVAGDTFRGTPFGELDLTRVGFAVIKALVTAHCMAHARPRYTTDYGYTSVPEEQFVRDMFSMRTEDLMEQWLPGRHRRPGVASIPHR